MKKMQKGFTLIELMIVVAIIAILAAIALPAYQNYVARSQATGGLADINGAKVGVEDALNRGFEPSLEPDEDGYVGVTEESTRCEIELDIDLDTGEGMIECTLQNSIPRVNGETVTLERDEDGRWTCETSVDERFAPQGCEAV